MTLTVNLSQKLISLIKKQVESGEFKNIDDFIEKAVKSELLALKRKHLAEIPNDIEELIEKAGLTEREIMEDFEIFREKLWKESPS